MLRSSKCMLVPFGFSSWVITARGLVKVFLLCIMAKIISTLSEVQASSGGMHFGSPWVSFFICTQSQLTMKKEKWDVEYRFKHKVKPLFVHLCMWYRKVDLLDTVEFNRFILGTNVFYNGVIRYHIRVWIWWNKTCLDCKAQGSVSFLSQKPQHKSVHSQEQRRVLVREQERGLFYKAPCWRSHCW